MCYVCPGLKALEGRGDHGLKEQVMEQEAYAPEYSLRLPPGGSAEEAAESHQSLLGLQVTISHAEPGAVSWTSSCNPENKRR